jgi:hypothetical protein
VDVRGDRDGAWSRAARPEWIALAGVLLLAAFLRLHALDLVEFKRDEATAVDLARGVLDGAWPAVGLTSSVGALDPPFFVYLIALPLAVQNDPLAATAFIGVLAVAAVALTFLGLRQRFGSLVALTAAAFFATAPWAVLYGRKIWAQDALPIVDILLLWCLFVVLERRRTRAVLLVPALLCLSFQLNFSALALVAPVAVVLAYRAREVDWLAFVAGVVIACLLLGPWLGHEAAHGFVDVGRLVSQGRGDRGPEPVGSGTVVAMHQTVNLLGAWNWGYVAGPSRAALAADAGLAWRWGIWASALTAAMMVVGFVTCAIRVGLGTRRRRGWPWLELDLAARRRALLLVWLLGVWLSYVTTGTDVVFPHYLIVTYPVSFAVAALGGVDVFRLLQARLRFAAIAAGIAAAAALAGYVAFTVAFLRFVDRQGGTRGDYGVVYRDEEALARVMKRRGLRVENQPALELLASGTIDEPPPDVPLVEVRNRLADATPLSWAGARRSFGPLLACLPRSDR